MKYMQYNNSNLQLHRRNDLIYRTQFEEYIYTHKSEKPNKCNDNEGETTTNSCSHVVQ